jgi:subtilisin
VNPDANAGQGVRVAVIDSGIANHPDLEGRVVDGISYGIGEYWEDYEGHGTMVAGTIAAIDNGNHLIGASPRVFLYAIKPGSWDSFIDAINWAVNEGANIISISLGFYEYQAPSGYLDRLEDACDNAYYNNRVLLIAGSGNTGEAQIMYPAAFDSVIAVGAVDQNDNRAWFSNYGGELDFAAPGVNINSTFPPNTYLIDTGTSFAVPHVTGAAALIFASKVDTYYDSNGNGRWDNSEVRAKLKDTALDLGPQGKDGYYGYGLVNAWYSNQRPPGDINYDLMVDVIDLSIVNFWYGTMLQDPDWWYARRADIAIDNLIDVMDVSLVSMHYGEIDP